MMNIAVIGGGVFGVMTAIRLAEAGQTVSVFERLPGLMQGASVNANRLHMGFHYPRDAETARQCLRGARAFREDFGDAIISGVSNAYFIAREASLTSSDDYLAHCDRLGLRYRIIDPDTFQPPVTNVALGMMTDEGIYTADVLRELMVARLQRSGARILVDHDVLDIRRTGTRGIELSSRQAGTTNFDAVVNCAYADINRLTAQMGHRIETRQYEYAAVPVIEVDWPQLVSITVIDGAFMSLLPFGERGRYLLYHVSHSVIAQSDAPLLDRAWLDPHTSPFSRVDRREWFDRHLECCCHFIPALRSARLTGVVQGPRMVLANRDDTDARPSLVTAHTPDYLTVFAGKIDHCTWVADEVATRLGLAVA